MISPLSIHSTCLKIHHRWNLPPSNMIRSQHPEDRGSTAQNSALRTTLVGSHDFSFSFNPPGEAHPELGRALYDVSLTIHPGEERRLPSIEDLSPLHMGTWDDVPLFEDVSGPPFGYAGESSAGPSSGVAPNVPADATKSIPTSASGNPDPSLSPVAGSDPLGTSIQASTDTKPRAAEHNRARDGIRVRRFGGASRVAVSPSIVAITQPQNGEASDGVRTENAETGSPR